MRVLDDLSRRIATPLCYTVPGRPASWQRSTPLAHGKVVSAKAYRAAKQRVAMLALQARQRARLAVDAEGEWAVDVVAWYPDRRHGDADRVCSLVMDAMEGVIYASDRQVKDQRSRVMTEPSGEPRTEVRVWRLT